MVVAHFINDLEDGGAQSILYELCCNLHSNHVVVVSFRGPGKYGELLKELGVELITLDRINPFFLPFGLIKLCIWAKSRKFEAIQCWMYHACLFSCLFWFFDYRTRIYWGIHNSKLTFTESKLTTILVCKVLALLSYFIPNRIIYCADYSRLHHEKIGYCKSRSTVIRNGYNLQKYKYCADLDAVNASSPSSVSSREFKIFMAARYDLIKGHEYLLSALEVLAQTIPYLSATFVGQGVTVENSYFKKWLDRLAPKMRIEFLGQINDLSQEYKKYDLLVMPSLQEAFPNVLCEAMACGIPCVASDVGDVATILDGSGWIVEPRNSSDIVSGIGQAYEEWLNKPELWHKRKSVVREKIATRYAINNMRDLYVSAWER